MKVRIVNRRAFAQGSQPGYGDNIFASVQESCGVQAVVPAAAAPSNADVLHPDRFSSTGRERVTKATPEDQRGVSCFSATGMIMTSAGAKPVSDLRVGDAVLTRDNGFQTLKWMGHVAGDHAVPCVVEIQPDGIAPGVPCEALHVSGRQCVLLSCPEIAQRFGTRDVLARAYDLLHLDGFRQVDSHSGFYALMFERHEILRVNDAWLESLQPDQENLRKLSPKQRDEITALFPDLAALPLERSYPAARPHLRRAFARQLQRI